ncbi:hypothetical protein MTQ13_03345 [Streptomyces sp. XM4011]|uniref:hypothetical protein n=1 Tax=Streptomyces sp. XM4011 TaxID=2929780 RepID=UPI001FF9BCFA|nr:hypothetical protein [Streptomyces sp. XM4011]MCK1813315.1 hypothetical protein [Streptomyces sp. XM4011]
MNTTPLTHEQIAAHFRRDTTRHRLTILHDDGLYRHLRWMSPRGAGYLCELVTWPGWLAIRGTANASYMFGHATDMLGFFRGADVTPGSWAERLPRGRDSALEYSADVTRRLVRERTSAAIQSGTAPRGLGVAVRKEILTSGALYYESTAKDALRAFTHKGWSFGLRSSDLRDWAVRGWELRDYRLDYLLACQAIAAIVRAYDEATATQGGAA